MHPHAPTVAYAPFSLFGPDDAKDLAEDLATAPPGALMGLRYLYVFGIVSV